MKKTALSVALLSAALAFNSANAQIAAKKGITIEEVSKEINEIAAKNNDESKAKLAVEAKALVASNNEQFVSLGARLYDYIGDEKAAELANKSILKKFPKGIKARQEALDKIFNEENKDGATKIEQQYAAWLKKFPSASFDEKSQNIYDQAKSNMAIFFFKENNIAKGNEYVNQLKSSANFPIYAISIVNTLIKEKQYATALPIAELAYNTAEAAFLSTDPAVKRSNVAGRYTSLAPLYARVLAESNQNQKSIQILEKYFDNYSYGKYSPENIILIANNYTKLGRDLDAFNILNEFLVQQSASPEIIAVIEPIYGKLNNNKGNFDTYLTKVKAQANDALLAKYKSEMIKKEAPNFSLLNMKGEKVSLADLKGKVVVLDFWATWCGPCKISFPGMQAAVNKYKDDKEVEFLFIDTWQREENYKDLVEQFIADNKYTFHVLYDEMKDRDKATTTAFGVKGIPHKVVIDKEGNIRFESSGGSADVEKIVNELSTKIELARKG